MTNSLEHITKEDFDKTVARLQEKYKIYIKGNPNMMSNQQYQYTAKINVLYELKRCIYSRYGWKYEN